MPDEKGPDIQTLMLLGGIMQSEERDKPTLPVDLTAVECQALASLSRMRFEQLFHVEGEAASRMAKIYLHITSKLTVSLLAHSMGFAKERDERMTENPQSNPPQDSEELLTTNEPAPDRAEEKRVEVPQNTDSVVDAGPVDGTPENTTDAGPVEGTPTPDISSAEQGTDESAQQ